MGSVLVGKRAVGVGHNIPVGKIVYQLNLRATEDGRDPVLLAVPRTSRIVAEHAAGIADLTVGSARDHHDVVARAKFRRDDGVSQRVLREPLILHVILKHVRITDHVILVFDRLS